jgi:hypothetical protein
MYRCIARPLAYIACRVLSSGMLQPCPPSIHRYDFYAGHSMHTEQHLRRCIE